MVSMGYEASPDPTVTPQPSRKFTPRWSLRSAGSRGLTESQIPKQSPLQITIPTHEITNPLQRPASPSLAMVFLQTSTKPVNCFCPPFFDDLRSFESLVLAQSKEQTKRRETDPAAPPEARFPKNQTKQPSLSLFLPKSLLKQSFKEKLRAWVGKYLMTLVPFPFQRAFTPSSARIRWVQSTIPPQGRSRVPALSMASTFWSLSLTTSMGEAKVLETAAETPPMRKSRKKVPMSFFLPLFSAILLKQNYNNVEHNSLLDNVDIAKISPPKSSFQNTFPTFYSGRLAIYCWNWDLPLIEHPRAQTKKQNRQKSWKICGLKGREFTLEVCCPSPMSLSPILDNFFILTL